jgi:hypothetical protein
MELAGEAVAPKDLPLIQQPVAVAVRAVVLINDWKFLYLDLLNFL